MVESSVGYITGRLDPGKRVVRTKLMMMASVREGVGVDEQLFCHQQQQCLGGARTKGGQGVVLPRPAVGGVRASRLSEDLPVGCHQRCRVADLVCLDHVCLWADVGVEADASTRNTGDERTKNVLFGEYGNTGPGASGTRASFSRKLNAPVTMEAVLGSGFANAAFYDAEYV